MCFLLTDEQLALKARLSQLQSELAEAEDKLAVVKVQIKYGSSSPLLLHHPKPFHFSYDTERSKCPLIPPRAQRHTHQPRKP